MSTQGVGTAYLVLAAPFGIAVGAGILIGQYWQHYCEAKAREYAEAAQAEFLAASAHTDTIQSAFSFATCMETAAQATTSLDSVADEKLQETLRRTIARTQTTLQEARRSLMSAQEAKRHEIQLRLTMEIEACRTLLPPSLLAQAQHAQDGTLADIQEALATLEAARQQQETPSMRLLRQQGQVSHTLRLVKTLLGRIENLFAQAETELPADLAERRRSIAALLTTAQAALAADVGQAQQLAVEAQRVARVLLQDATAHLFTAWEDLRGQLNTHIGTLTTLKDMVQEAQAAQMAQNEPLAALTQRITSASHEAEAIEQSSSLRVAARLHRLAERTALLKADVFALLESYQQRTIAATIATTLHELGFQAIDGTELAVQGSGDDLRVMAMRSEQTAGVESNGRLVSFTVAPAGTVSYDFSGYADEACVEEAERIFTALRRSGLYLLDPPLAAHLQAIYPEGVPTHTLNQQRYQLHPTANKVQMELAQRIQFVLEQMHYTHIQQSAVGGCIEFDAFNGPLGYHVVLTPEGTMQVLQNVQDADMQDVSADAADPLVAEARRVLAQRALSQSQEQRAQEAVQQQRSTYPEQQRTRLMES